MLGLDEEGHPVGDRLNMEDVAEVEARVNNTAPKTKQAIQKQLAPYGLDEKAIDDLYDQDSRRRAGDGRAGAHRGRGRRRERGARNARACARDRQRPV